jgi:hypothetical protein
MVWDDASDAIKAKTFESRSDRHLSRTPLTLDEEGWEEVNQLLAKTLSKAEEIAAKSAKRRGKSDAPEVQTRMVMMHFESPKSSS